MELHLLFKHDIYQHKGSFVRTTQLHVLSLFLLQELNRTYIIIKIVGREVVIQVVTPPKCTSLSLLQELNRTYIIKIVGREVIIQVTSYNTP